MIEAASNFAGKVNAPSAEETAIQGVLTNAANDAERRGVIFPGGQHEWVRQASADIAKALESRGRGKDAILADENVTIRATLENGFAKGQGNTISFTYYGMNEKQLMDTVVPAIETALHQARMAKSPA